MKEKGQGTIEYLVIIAIVVVIALVVVGLLSQTMDQGKDIPKENAKIAWLSGSPLSAVDWDFTTSNNMTVILRNNSYETITVTDFNITRNSTGIYDGNTLNKTLAPGDTYAININPSAYNAAGTGCTTGTGYVFDKDDITITYNSSKINSKTQSAPAEIAGTC